MAVNKPEVERTINNLPIRNSPKRETVKYGASPFDDEDGEAIPSLMNTVSSKPTATAKVNSSGAPNVAADIITSTKPSMKTATAAIINEETPQGQKGGRLFKAIKKETESMKAALRMRHPKRKHTRKL